MWTLRKQSTVKYHNFCLKCFLYNTTKFYNTSSYFIPTLLWLFHFTSHPSYWHFTRALKVFCKSVSVFQGSTECPVHCGGGDWRPGEALAEAVLRQELSNFHETVSHFSSHWELYRDKAVILMLISFHDILLLYFTFSNLSIYLI